jgi:hypothetical protein
VPSHVHGGETRPSVSPRAGRSGLGGLSDQLGLSASEVAKALGYSPANDTNLLKRLEELNHLVRDPGERPARWRRPSAATA